MNLPRRNFLGLSALMPLSVFSFKDRLKKVVKKYLLPLLQTTVSLPSEGKNISVETALNSRCSSDFDNDPKTFHWGMFDRWKKLSSKHISILLEAMNIPRFTDKKTTAYVDKEMLTFVLTFVIDASATGIEREWLWIESGMQQQAVCLICAALGIGTCVRGSNMGPNGKLINNSELATVEMRLGAMKPSFNGSYWSKSPPTGANAWQSGDLPDPDREGKIPLLSIIYDLKKSGKGTANITPKIIGQLLWATRGRTPHCYLSKPWGMTIPTWKALQETSSPYLVSNDGTFKYVNWGNDRPTNSIQKINDISISPVQRALGIQNAEYLIMLGINENAGKAFWEIGYQLENIILQATSLGIGFEATLLTLEQRDVIHRLLGIPDLIAAVGISEQP